MQHLPPPSPAKDNHRARTLRADVEMLLEGIEACPETVGAVFNLGSLESCLCEAKDAGVDFPPVIRRRIARALSVFTPIPDICIPFMIEDLAQRIPMCDGPDLADEAAVTRFLATNGNSHPYRLTEVERRIEAICDVARALHQHERALSTCPAERILS